MYGQSTEVTAASTVPVIDVAQHGQDPNQKRERSEGHSGMKQPAGKRPRSILMWQHDDLYWAEPQADDSDSDTEGKNRTASSSLEQLLARAPIEDNNKIVADFTALSLEDQIEYTSNTIRHLFYCIMY